MNDWGILVVAGVLLFIVLPAIILFEGEDD